MENSHVLEFVLFMSGDNRNEISTTLASLRRQTSSDWTARVVTDQEIEHKQVESMTGRNPRIQLEQTEAVGTFSKSGFRYEVFVPEGSVLDEDAVQYLVAIVVERSPSLLIGRGLQGEHLVVVAPHRDSSSGVPTLVYQRSLFTLPNRDSHSSRVTSSLTELAEFQGSLQDLLIEKNRRIDELESLLHRKNHEFRGVESHLRGLELANAGLSEANNGLHTANNELNRINNDLLNRRPRRGVGRLLQRLRN